MSSRHRNLEPWGGGTRQITSVCQVLVLYSFGVYSLQPSRLEALDLGALHPCPHATVTWSPGEVARDNIPLLGRQCVVQPMAATPPPVQYTILVYLADHCSVIQFCVACYTLFLWNEQGSNHTCAQCKIELPVHMCGCLPKYSQVQCGNLLLSVKHVDKDC